MPGSHIHYDAYNSLEDSSDELIVIIHACNASGLTRKAWCEQNGIKIKTFYYWQRQLRREAHDAHKISFDIRVSYV